MDACEICVFIVGSTIGTVDSRTLPGSGFADRCLA